MNKINHDGWVAINCIPTAVHTIAGCLIGKLFLSNAKNKIKPLLIWGLACLIIRIWFRCHSYNTDHQTHCHFIFYACCFRLVPVGFGFLLLVDRYIKSQKIPAVLFDCRNEFTVHLFIF
jgi:hypothetical protein